MWLRVQWAVVAMLVLGCLEPTLAMKRFRLSSVSQTIMYIINSDFEPSSCNRTFHPRSMWESASNSSALMRKSYPAIDLPIVIILLCPLIVRQPLHPEHPPRNRPRYRSICLLLACFIGSHLMFQSPSVPNNSIQLTERSIKRRPGQD